MLFSPQSIAYFDFLHARQGSALRLLYIRTDLLFLQKMVQKYGRNMAKEANEDVSELVYWIVEEKIQITYHTANTKIISSTREYMKPQGVEEKGSPVIMTPDMHSTFQVDPTRPPKKNLVLYQLLCKLLGDEDSCSNRVRESESEVKAILKERLEEETRSELEISVYDTDRNERAKKHRKELVSVYL